MKLLSILLIISILLIFFILFVFYNNLKPGNLLNLSTNQSNSQNAKNIIIGIEGSTDQNAMLFAIHSGVRYFREDINLKENQESEIKNFTNSGAHFIEILDYQTLGISTPCTNDCNWSLNDWNNSVSNAVKAYPEIHIWEIWNEPQFPVFQSGFQNGSPYNYYLTVKSAYKIIKGYNSSDKILCFGGDNVYTGQSNATINNYDFQWAYSAWRYGLSNYCDAISLHVYTDDTFLINQTAPGSDQSIGTIISNQLNMYENMTNKPIFITETGIPSNNGTGLNYNLNNSPAKQKEFLNQIFSLYLSKPYIKCIIWFNLIGYVNKPYNIDFGLLNNNFNSTNSIIQTKPAWYTFVNYTKAYG